MQRRMPHGSSTTHNWPLTDYTCLQIRKHISLIRFNMAVHDESIPIVDFSSILSESVDLSNCPQVAKIHSAFSTVGFVFLKNHGIDKQLVGLGIDGLGVICQPKVHAYVIVARLAHRQSFSQIN